MRKDHRGIETGGPIPQDSSHTDVKKRMHSLPSPALLHNALQTTKKSAPSSRATCRQAMANLDIVPPAVATGALLDDVAPDLARATRDTGPRGTTLRVLLRVGGRGRPADRVGPLLAGGLSLVAGGLLCNVRRCCRRWRHRRGVIRRGRGGRLSCCVLRFRRGRARGRGI